MNRISRAGLPAAAMALTMALGGCMGGTTYGTGVSPGKQTVDDIVGIVSLGNRSDKPPIDYKPRPPIVAPPKAAALPPPEDPKPATVANWPNDPDQKSGTTASGDVYIPVAKNAPAGPTDNSSLGERAYMDHLRFGKEKQKIYADAKASAAGAFDANGNPVRKTLSEPPADYRVPDPDAPDTFNTPTKKKWWQFGK